MCTNCEKGWHNTSWITPSTNSLGGSLLPIKQYNLCVSMWGCCVAIVVFWTREKFGRGVVSDAAGTITLFLVPWPTQNGDKNGWFGECFGSIHNSGRHNSPIYDECQTQKAKVLALLWERAHRDDSNDTPQPIGECQVSFPLLGIRINQDNP